MVRLHHTLELRCRDVLLVGRYYVFKLIFHDLHLVGFHISFKYQMKHQKFLVPTRRETRRAVWKTPVLESLFSKVPRFQVCNVMERGFQQNCFPLNIAKFLRTAFFIKNVRWLLLSCTSVFQGFFC